MRELLPSGVRDRPIVTALCTIAVVALLVRVLALGTKVMYYDEVWFGYWILKFIEHGGWEYRPIMHGPFFVRTLPVVFETLGPSEFSARILTAILGGLLPLVAWLYRDHLRRWELVGFALVLAFNPVVVYYSRFLRKDIPLVLFVMIALGAALRLRATGRLRYLYLGGAALGLAATTKESVLLYLVTFAGGVVAVVATQLVIDRSVVDSWATQVRSEGWPTVRRYWADVVLAGMLGLAIVVFFYAPRAGPGQPIGLWRALGGEWGTIPAVIRASTLGAFESALEHWLLGSVTKNPYIPFFVDTIQTLAAGASVTLVLAVVGVSTDWSEGGPRPIVTFGAFCGVAAIVGYPLANAHPVPWSTIHAIVPLGIPAAVGLHRAGEWLRPVVEDGLPTDSSLSIRPDGSTVTALLAVALVALLLFGPVSTLITTSYLAPERSPGVAGGSHLVYEDQAPAEIRAALADVERATTPDDGEVDVLYVGDPLVVDESQMERPPAPYAWHRRNPMPWYTEVMGAKSDSVQTLDQYDRSVPSVVITKPQNRIRVGNALGSDYTGTIYDIDQQGERLVFFVHDSIRQSP